MTMVQTDWYGGLEPDLDLMLPGKPSDPEMRESASIWLYEENGAFALPRNGVEAVGAVWENHRYDCNFAFKGGRVLRESTTGPTIPPQGPDGRNSILGAGGMKFECIEPFKKWRVSYRGQPFEATVEDQIAGRFGIFAGGSDMESNEGFARTPVSYDVELTMVTPCWTQDYRPHKLVGMSDAEKADAGSMGYGWRVEHLFRGEGELTVDGKTQSFKCNGSRIHRQSVRPMAEFRGHAWQSAVFPDGRAFGYIAYPLREGETEEQRYNVGYVYMDGVMYPAKAKNPAFLRTIVAKGDQVDVEMVGEFGTVSISGSTDLATFHLGNPGVNGFNNQQGGVRYEWDGQVAYGMIERSSPAALCRVVLENAEAV
jgi:hypothetical protein